MSYKNYPFLDDLSKEDFEKLAAIKTVDDIKTVVVEEEWTDDHCPCVGVRINDVVCSFWWLERSYASAFEYANDSVNAKKKVLAVIVEGVEISRGEREE
jgi:hypothetical protein